MTVYIIVLTLISGLGLMFGVAVGRRYGFRNGFDLFAITVVLLLAVAWYFVEQTNAQLSAKELDLLARGGAVPATQVYFAGVVLFVLFGLGGVVAGTMVKRPGKSGMSRLARENAAEARD